MVLNATLLNEVKSRFDGELEIIMDGYGIMLTDNKSDSYIVFNNDCTDNPLIACEFLDNNDILIYNEFMSVTDFEEFVKGF